MNILLHRLRANNFKQLSDIDLSFPDRCAFLIEGQNEAGKSSLFEAVFFALYGKTLITDQDYHIEHLKQYGAEELLVTLDFSVDGRPFSISRRVGMNHTVKLTCPSADGGQETISQIGEVKRRLAEELRLSADAALNTCFVEQKKLERLEDLQPSVRRETINELLNLRILTSLEAEYRLTREDQDEIRRLRDRVKLAELDAGIPVLEEDARAAERCLAYTRLLDAHTRIQDLDRRLAVVEGRLAEIAARRKELAASLEECRKLRDQLTAIDSDIRHRLQAWRSALHIAGEKERHVETLEGLAGTLPGRAQQLAGWKALLAHLTALEELAQAETDLAAAEKARHDAADQEQRLAELQQEMEALSSPIQEARKKVQGAAERLSQARTRQALLAWAEAAEQHATVDVEGGNAAQVAERQRAAQNKLAGAESAAAAAARRMVPLSLVAGFGVVVALAGFGPGRAVCGILGLLILAVGAALVMRARSALAAAQVEVAAARTLRDRLEGELAAARAQAEAGATRREQAAKRLAAEAARLQSLGTPVPESPQPARQTAAALDPTPVEQAEQGLETARGSLQALQSKLDGLQSAYDTLRQQPRPDAGQLASRVRDLAGEHHRLRAAAPADPAQVYGALQSDALPTAARALETTLAGREAELRRDQKEAEALPALRQALTEAGDKATAQARGLREAWSATLPEYPLSPDSEPSEQLLAEARVAIQYQLDCLDQAALRTEDESLQAEESRLTRDAAAVQQDQKRAAESLDAFAADLQGHTSTLNSQPSTLTNEQRASHVAGLPTRFPELARALEREAPEWELERNRRAEALRTARANRTVQARALGLGDDPLELAAEREAAAVEQRRQDVKRLGGEIVRKTRESIVGRVMPLTINNMQRLLPLLTEGRYLQAKWDDANNAILVYDSRAREFQRKRVFSGGARDQISLALRLAFALATLPAEHNIRPGWLFLDEPLSSFDRQRTQALVDLLTGGLIHKHFAQVFLISHSESFDPSRFDHRLRLESGRILECTLPSVEAVVQSRPSAEGTYQTTVTG